MDQSFLPQPLRVLFGNALQFALRRALELDPDCAQALRAMEGRRLQMELRPPGLAFAVQVRDGQPCVGPPQADATADLSLRSSLGGLLSLALPWRDADELAAGRLHMSGDAELARHLQKLMREFDPDLEDALARRFGDVPGVAIARVLQGLARFGRDSARRLAEDGVDYLRDESRELVAREELEEFNEAVDRLRDAVDRLEKKITRVRSRAAGEWGNGT